MKTINLKGLKNALSENEMKNITGGNSPDKPQDKDTDPVYNPCKGKSFGDKCEITWSGGTQEGTCARVVRPDGTYGLECIKK